MRATERELEKILKALANRRRLAIVTLLKRSSHMPVSGIAEKIKLSFKATSKHLSILASAGLVDREQQGLLMRYYLSKDVPPFVRTLLHAL